ncbi:MAG: cysteine synthase family protein [Deltaproteobacteria bacterium]|nr:cysteine synthase family protein [Deltaproteobacteria bacterium]
MLRLKSIERDAPGVELYCKLELLNPGGSVKDRPALQMIREGLESGQLEGGRTVIDATSGNTGVAYGMVGAALGIPVCLVMPENVTESRKKITAAYGVRIVYSTPMEGSDGAIQLVRKLVAEEPDRYFYPDQYTNEANPRAHYLGTGVEILEDVGDRITHFVSGLGTSGTVMGTGRRLKEHSTRIQVIGVEPAESLHGLEGLKHMATSIVPAIYHPAELDEVMGVSTEDGWDMTERLKREEGLFAGHSTGANVFAALQVAKRIGAGCVVTIACDRGDRYFKPRQWERHYEW